jgi:hypothetical protein
MSLIERVGYCSGLCGYACTGMSPDEGVPRQVHTLLLVTLQRTYILARLSLDTYLFSCIH